MHIELTLDKSILMIPLKAIDLRVSTLYHIFFALNKDVI